MLTEKDLDAEIEKWENAERVLGEMDDHQRTMHFRMNNWGMVNDCGTVACLAGSCALDPWFKEKGFEAEVPKLTLGESERSLIFRLHGARMSAERASHGFFRTGHNLFYDPVDWSEAMKMVHAHIRALRDVRDQEPSPEQANGN